MKNPFEQPAPTNPELTPKKLQSWAASIASAEQLPTEDQSVRIFDNEMGAAFTHIVRTPNEKREEITTGLNHFFKERLTEINSPISLSMDETDIRESLAKTLGLAGDMLRRVTPEADPLQRPAAHAALTVLRPDAESGQWNLLGATAGITKVYVYRKAIDEVAQVNIEDNRAGAAAPIIAGNMYHTRVAREQQGTFKHLKTEPDIQALTPQNEYLFHHRNEAAGRLLIGERVSQSDLTPQLKATPAKTFAATHLQAGDYVLIGGATLDSLDLVTLKKLLLRAVKGDNSGAVLAEAVAAAAADQKNIRKTPGPVSLGLIAVPAVLPVKEKIQESTSDYFKRMKANFEDDGDAPTREVGVFEGATSYADLYTILKRMDPLSSFDEDGISWTPAAIIASLRCVEDGIMKMREVMLPRSIQQKVKSFRKKK